MVLIEEANATVESAFYYKDKWKWNEGVSSNISGWYQPWEICVLNDDSVDQSMVDIRNRCFDLHGKPSDGIISFGCRAGGAFKKQKQACRVPGESSMKNHSYLLKSVINYDDPSRFYLKDLLENLYKFNGTLQAFGDSVSSHQVVVSLFCEVDRMQAALNNSENSHLLSLIKDLQDQRFPVNFHLAKTLELNELQNVVNNQISVHDSFLFLMNTGLHFNMETHMNNNILRDYINRTFAYLDDTASRWPHKKFVFLWMDTSAQHFMHTPASENQINPNKNGVSFYYK